MNVIFNESVVRGSGATAQRVFTHLGEGQTNDGLGVVSQQSTTTGYYLRKFLDYTNINFDAASPGQTFHLWPLIRYADILLLYAEMMNAAYGPENPHTYGMTAKQAVERVRQRAGITGYLLPEGLSKEPMFEWIKKERRVELCFEEQRFFDLRRWKDVESLKQPVGGLKITKTGDSYTFQQIVVDNARAFTDRMYFQPIPVTETINLGIPQNPGW